MNIGVPAVRSQRRDADFADNGHRRIKTPANDHYQLHHFQSSLETEYSYAFFVIETRPALRFHCIYVRKSFLRMNNNFF
jgi:hypothetical protein